MIETVGDQIVLRVVAGPFQLEWSLRDDQATIRRTSEPNGNAVWSGALLPLWWIEDGRAGRQCIKARLAPGPIESTDASTILPLTLGDWGNATLHLVRTPSGMNFTRLTVNWAKSPPPIIGLYFGALPLNDRTSSEVPRLDRPFWPNWQAEGFCVPNAKGSPIQSFWRCWEFGHADIPLGNFGIAMGTPYVGAFPRPILAAAMGGDLGWIALGAGSIPDGAMTLQVRASCGCIEYLYREDLWGRSEQPQRTWDQPLRLAMGEDAFTTFANLYDTFGPFEPTARHHLRSHWTNWGDFLEGNFDIRASADFAADMLGAQVYGMEDYWETWVSSGVPDRERFPTFDADIAYLRDKGLELHIWQSVGWVTKPEEVDLGDDDLLCGIDGRPRRATWNMNPHASDRRNYMLDPSSPRARQFLANRMHRIMRELRPTWLKMDFSYGLHGPDVAAPRDPAYRGERLGHALMKICVDAAREVDPKVTIQNYSLHPLLKPLSDLISLDDLGDAFGDTAGGHGHWSIWSALAGRQKTAVLSSSGYDWAADTDQLLNAAVTGVPSAVLARKFRDGRTVQPQWICHRRALNRWFRCTAEWQPLWLNTEPGALGRAPTVRCWGRLEPIDGAMHLTALALRDGDRSGLDLAELRDLDFSGRWALISQDDRSIYDSSELVAIPFDDGWIRLPLTGRPSDVQRITTTGSASADWQWQDGQLHLESNNAQRATLLGYLIRR